MVKKLIFFAVFVFAVSMAFQGPRSRVQGGIDSVMNTINTRLQPRRLKQMTDQIEVRFDRGEGFPNDFPTWLRMTYTGPDHDPWGNVYFLQVGRREYTVGTMGPDGVQGTDDDVTLTVPTPKGR